MIRRALPALLLGLSIATAPSAASTNDLRSIAGMRSRNPVLIVFAPSLRDTRLTAQRRELSRNALDVAARDLVLVQVSGPKVIGAHDEADRLRRRFQVAPATYRSILVRQDGTVALASPTPIAGPRLIGALGSARPAH